MQNKASRHKLAIMTAFNNAASTYDAAAIVEQEIATRLLERLAYFQLSPKRILDIGCGTAILTQQLQNMYPTASIIGVDIALQMLNFARAKHKQQLYCCADAEFMPFARQSFDLIISNCCFMWLQDWSQLFAELNRLITPGGGIFFSCFAPNTLSNIDLVNHWPSAYAISNMFGSLFRDPVIETENIVFHYSKLKDLFQDLHDTGTCFFDTTQDFPALHAPFEASFEVVFSHAWGKQIQQYKDADGKVYVPLETITGN